MSIPTPVEHLRETIRQAGVTIRDNYPDVGGGALMVATSVECERLARLVSPCTEPHKWLYLGSCGEYCERCGTEKDKS